MALDHSRLGLENKFLENKSGRIFLRSTGLLYKFLPTNLGVCKPTFYTFYTLHMRWNSPIYCTDLGQNAVFHSFSRQIALSCQPVLISSARCQFGRVFERTLIVTLQHNKEFIIIFFLLFNGFSYNDVWSYKAFDTRDIFKYSCKWCSGTMKTNKTDKRLTLQERLLTINKRNIIRWNIYRDNTFHSRRQVLKCL